MGKFEVRTTNAVLVYDADGFEQANRLGRDGGRIVLSVTELSDDGDAVSTHDPRDADFGDEEVVVVSASEYDRLVGLARLVSPDLAADAPPTAEPDAPFAAPTALGPGEEVVPDADGAPTVETAPTPVGPDGQPIAFETVAEPEGDKGNG
jgi:hypothetical protein